MEQISLPTLTDRPLPAWFDEAKIGIFIHWGPYSVPGFEAEHATGEAYGVHGNDCWYEHSLMHPVEKPKVKEFHDKAFGPGVTYTEIARLFKAELYKPADWADLFQRSGAKYVLLTSKFHDGFCLWPSLYSPRWNSVEVGAHRDLLGELFDAVRGVGLRAGFYYSLLEHGHPMYNNPAYLDEYVAGHVHPQLKEAVNEYKPAFIYLDGEWDYPEEVWRMREWAAWLYNDSPVKDEVVVNDRWGTDSRGKRGDVYCSEIGMLRDREHEHGFSRKWMEDRPLSRNWSRNRNQRLEHYLSERDMLHILIETVANGGNINFDIAPYADGTIPMIEQERLMQLGDWLRVNGEAIYGTHPWRTRFEGPAVPTRYPYLDENLYWAERHETPMVHYTAKEDAVYAICKRWPKETLVLKVPRSAGNPEITLLGYGGSLSCRETDGQFSIDVPYLTVDELPCRVAYVFKMTGIV